MHEKQKLLGIFAGDRDPVFSYTACQNVLHILIGEKAAKNTLQLVRGGHASVVSSMGQAQLAKVADWLEEQLKVGHRARRKGKGGAGLKN